MALTEFQEKWVAALRSGEFKQGKHVLRSDDGEYCCLGVACELLARDGKVERVIRDDQVVGFRGPDTRPFDGYASALLTDDIVPLVGVFSPAGALSFTNIGDTLSDMNDDGRPFEEIADVIEKAFG